jgi:DEAD/DEAH box helicase domain-containing protein
VAKETLGVQKIGKGLDALEYYRDGDWEKLTKYCLKDVEVTRDVYIYGLREGRLKFKNKWNRVFEVPVDFAEEKAVKATVQTTLF